MKVMMNLLVAVNLSTRQLPIDVYIVVITVEPKGKASVFCLKLRADETYRSIKSKIMSDPYFPRLCVRARFNFYDQNA